MTPLHYIGETLRQLLAAVPLPMVRILFVGTLLAVLIWVWRLPREAISADDAPKRWDANLKWIAAVSLAIQIAIYLIL